MHWPVAALVAATVAIAAAAGDAELHAPADPDQLALARAPGLELIEMATAALAPPPASVVRETGYFGTVTLDHRAHLERRAKCVSCHGPGPVRKIEFTPKTAHERCIGCHQQLAKGPEKCQGCHVRPPPPAETLAASPSEPPPPPPAPEPNPANLAAAIEALQTGPLNSGAGLFTRAPFQRFLEVGLAGGRGLGASVRVTSHQDQIVVSQSVEQQRSGSDTRTFGMFGAGVSRAGRGRISLEAQGLLGFDLVERPTLALLPAIGVRAGTDWRPDHLVFQRLALSVTCAVDLSRGPSRQPVGGATLYATITTGFRLP